MWDALESSLEAAAHRLARNIAKTLEVDPAPLLQALKTEKVKVYLYDDQADQEHDMSEMKCKEIVRISEMSPFVKQCNTPIVWPDSTSPRKCLAHCLKPSELKDKESHILYPFEVSPDMYYLDKDTGELYNHLGILVGKYNGTKNIVTLFEIAE